MALCFEPETGWYRTFCNHKLSLGLGLGHRLKLRLTYIRKQSKKLHKKIKITKKTHACFE